MQALAFNLENLSALPTDAELQQLAELERNGNGTIDPAEVERRRKREEFVRVIAPKLTVRLTGYDRLGKALSQPDEDAKTILSIEKPLIVDPFELGLEMAMIQDSLSEAGGDFSRLSHEQFPLIHQGFHSHALNVKTLQYERGQGFGLIAEIGRHPVASLHGFLSVPLASDVDDTEINLNSLDAFDIPGAPGRVIQQHRKRIMAIWRTSVAKSIPAEALAGAGVDVSAATPKVDIRRIGLGTALKCIAVHLAAFQNKLSVILNVGQITPRSFQSTGGKPVVPNWASTEYNGNFLQPVTWRNFHTLITLKQKIIAEMFWQLFQGKLAPDAERGDGGEVMQKIHAVLKHIGWTPESLDNLCDIARTASHQLRSEGMVK